MTKTVVSVLSKLLSSCQEMLALLHQDQENLRQQQLVPLTLTNPKKTALLDHIQTLLQQCHFTKSELGHPDILRLRENVELCYHQVAINSKVIFANLEKMANIQQALIQHAGQQQRTYDGKGLLK